MKKCITILLIGILVLWSIIPAYGDGSKNIRIQTDIGFDKTYRAGFITPVVITVENNEKDIDGEIQIEIPSSEGPMGVSAVNLYAIGINHPKNTVKKYTMNIPIPSSLLNVKLRIVEGKDTLIEQYVRIDRGIDQNMMLAGVLSDNPGNLDYLYGFTFKNLQGSTGMKIANLNNGSFPLSVDTMNSFNMLIINDYDSSKLSQKQYDTMKRWVEQGGFLILGTGANGGKTLSIFKDDFIIGERGGFLKVSGKGLGTMTGDGFSETIDVMDIKLKGGMRLVTENDVNLIQYIDKGKGRILLLSFDLGLEPISSWKLNRYFTEALLERTAPSFYSGMYFEKYMASGRGYDYTIDRALRNIPELPLPGYKTITILFAVYILLAAPISYILLKKRDKREWMWVVVPALSVIFAVFIYFIGFGTRLTGPIINKISIIYADDTGFMRTKSFGGVFTPNKTDLKVEGVEGTRVKPLLNQNYYSGSYQNWDNKKIETKIMLSPKAAVEYYDIGVWNMRTLTLENDEAIKGGITGEIRYINSDFNGTIENSTDFDLENCYIISSFEYMPIGNIKSGEKKEIKGLTNKYYGTRYDLMDSLYNIYQRRNSGQKLTDEEIAELRLSNQKRDIMEYLFADDPQGIQGIMFIGWTKDPVAGQIKVNGKNVRSYEKSLVVAEMKLGILPGKEVELPLGYIKPVIDQNLSKGGYESYENMVYGAGTLEVSFNIGEIIAPERISIKYDKPDLNVRQFIWNAEQNGWEMGDFSSFYIEKDHIAKYLGESQVLRFKFEIDNSKFQLPQISVKGSVK